MNLRNICTVVACTLVLSLSAASQERVAAVEFSPVPPYPSEGLFPNELKDQFVFIDFARNDVVVSYPNDNLPGRRIEHRFGRHTQVEPVVTSSLAAQQDGSFLYKYSVQNAAQAKRPMKTLAISNGEAGATTTARHPVWVATVTPSDIATPGSLRPEALITWTGRPGTHLARGQSATGFEIASKLRPGLVIGFAQASVDAEVTDAIARSLPAAAREQLALVMNPHWDTAQFMTVGPKFAPSDPKSLIAMDFHKSLSKLSIVGPLKADSSFVRGALAALVSYMSESDTNSIQLGFLDTAAPGLESEVASAMRISLK